MAIHVFKCFGFIFLASTLLNSILEVQACSELRFTNQESTLDNELQENFGRFKIALKASPYYAPSVNTKPIMDFVGYLTNNVQTPGVSLALDYLLKTGGPFGWRKEKITRQERVLMAAASQIVAEVDPTRKDQDYGATRTKHLSTVLQFQNAPDKSAHPLRGPVIKPACWDAANDPVIGDIGNSWEVFKEFLTLPSLFTKTFRPFRVWNDLKEEFEEIQYSFLNDIELIGFLTGTMPDINDKYIDDLWRMDNDKMERQHNYVQWLFPIHTVGLGDREKAPRFTPSIQQTLARNAKVHTLVQQVMRLSFARKANFWGQKVVYGPGGKVYLEPLIADDTQNPGHKNWITHPHNYLRMTRFLRSLEFFGLKPEKEALFAYLTKTKDSVVGAKTKSSFDNFWEHAYQNPFW